MQRHHNRDLVQVLIQDPDPTNRSRAHRELAVRAAAREDLGKALRHYEEAAAIDPTDEVAREAAQRLGAEITAPPKLGVWGRLVRGFAKA